MKVLKEFLRLKWEERKTILYFFLVIFGMIIGAVTIICFIELLAYCLAIIIISIIPICWIIENWQQAKKNVEEGLK